MSEPEVSMAVLLPHGHEHLAEEVDWIFRQCTRPDAGAPGVAAVHYTLLCPRLDRSNHMTVTHFGKVLAHPYDALSRLCKEISEFEQPLAVWWQPWKGPPVLQQVYWDRALGRADIL